MRTIAVVAACAIPLFCGAGEALAFSASFRWCSPTPHATTSPAFALSSIPKGTASFDLQMSDHQSAFHHGGGQVEYHGGRSIPCGAIASGWVGPFPPSGERHSYEFTIRVLDSAGKTLGEAHATRRFPE